MHCIKTGFYAKLPNGRYIHGDAFQLCPYTETVGDQPDVFPVGYLLLRICAYSIEQPERLHLSFESWARWFDDAANGHEVDSSTAIIYTPNSTMIVPAGQWQWLGYEDQESQS